MINVDEHRNILRPLGFCMTRVERLLVYPYMANGSVASWLRERPESQPALSWPIRKQIALGVARGLAYLHDDCDPRIVHRDVKAGNILLDEDFEAVVSDFSLAIRIGYNDTKVTTDTITATMGYMAPEYLANGICSVKIDVFGYGVMLLELISGQCGADLVCPDNDHNIVSLEWLKGLLKENKQESLVDDDLMGNYIYSEVKQLIQVALLCTQISPIRRPEMSEVIRMLEGDGLEERWEEWLKEELSENQQLPNKPWFIWMLEVDDLAERFSLRELQVATDNFSNENIIHRSTYVMVYKGQLALAHGSPVLFRRLVKHTDPVAIRRLLKHQRLNQRLQTEVELIGRAEHRNILHLRGFCMTREEMLLVYPYMANGSVASWLRDRPESQPPLNFAIRKQIAVEAARGLAYLHDDCDPRIIHRDVKAANILLDYDFEAILCGFSLAIRIDYNDTQVTTDVCGTIGHIAPEYLADGICSVKCDVFGYGVMLLELISGQRAFDADRDEDMMLVDWVKGQLKKTTMEGLIDKDLAGSYIYLEMVQLIHVALLCSQSSPMERPEMSQVIRMLEGKGMEYTSDIEKDTLSEPR